MSRVQMFTDGVLVDESASSRSARLALNNSLLYLDITNPGPVTTRSGALLDANSNLAGLLSIATARTNIGLGSADNPTFNDLTVSGGTINLGPSSDAKIVRNATGPTIDLRSAGGIRSRTLDGSSGAPIDGGAISGTTGSFFGSVAVGGTGTFSGNVIAQLEVLLGTNVNRPRIFSYDGNLTTTQNSAGQSLGFYTWNQSTVGHGFAFSGQALQQTTGSNSNVIISRNITPTSGSGTFAVAWINTTVNQTGGANGITRGLYVLPTLTAAADFRGIDIGDVGSHYAIKTGTGKVQFGDVVGIGVTPTAKLHVLGPGAIGKFDSGSATDARLEFLYNGSRQGTLSWDNGNVSLSADSGKVVTSLISAVERFRVSSSGISAVGSATVTDSVSASSGTSINQTLQTTYTQSGTSGSTNLVINRIETSLGSGLHLFADFQVAGSNRFRVFNSGNILTSGNIQLGGSSGAILKYLSGDIQVRNSADAAYMGLVAANGSFNGTMTVTGNVTAGTARPVTLNGSSGFVSIQAGAGGWDMQTRYLGSAGTNLGGFGAAGTNDNLDVYYIGTTASRILTAYQGKVLIGNTGVNGVYPGKTLELAESTDYSARLRLRGSSTHKWDIGCGYGYDPGELQFSPSTGNPKLYLRQDGKLDLSTIRVGAIDINPTSVSPWIYAFSGTANLTPVDGGLGLAFYSYQNSTANSHAFSFGGTTANQTSGSARHVYIARGFAPTSGTSTYDLLNLTPTINQTGGANGITRGLYVAPTLTAAADFRGIEISDVGSHYAIKTGTGVHSFGGSVTTTGDTTTSGALCSGGFTPATYGSAYKLQVSGSAVVQSQVATSGNIILNVVQGVSVTGSTQLIRAVGASSGSSEIYVQNTNNGQAKFYALVVGTGDAQSTWAVNGGVTWSAGVDQSDSSAFVLSKNATLGSSNVFRVDATTLNTVFSGTVTPQKATTAGAPAWVNGAVYFDTTLNKLRIGGAAGWETVTSV